MIRALIAILLPFALWLAIIGHAISEAQFAPCDTDTDCMRLHGGDGSPDSE